MFRSMNPIVSVSLGRIRTGSHLQILRMRSAFFVMKALRILNGEEIGSCRSVPWMLDVFSTLHHALGECFL